MSPEQAESPHERALRHVARLSSGPSLDPDLRVAVHFHPDRQAGGRSLLAAMADDGVYHSQFVTRTSNGGLTAYLGGDRWNWEHRLFAGAYDDLPAHARPIYGALNFRRRPVGAAPRFGSAHLRLNAAALARSSFCHPDSVFEPTVFGMASRMSLVEMAEADDRDLLDDYIEAHVHGGVRLDRDVEALVLDPSHRDTDVAATAGHLPCPVEWHPASGSRSTSYASTRPTEVRSTSTSVPKSQSTGSSTRESAETPQAPAGMTSKISSESGTTSRATASNRPHPDIRPRAVSTVRMTGGERGRGQQPP